MSAILDPRSIENEIARIREREGNPYLSGIRTNLFNLVICKEAGGPDPAAAALRYLLGKRPARIITLDTSREAGTKVSVDGRCYPDARNRGVCFEEITIESGGDSRGTELGSWSPLLIRDLPVFVWWVGSLTPVPALLLEGYELIDKLIVDTGTAPDALEVLSQLSLLREKTQDVMALTDLGWRRTFPLRVHVARMFNPPEARERLGSIQEVSLHGGTRAEALLFALWLAARLGWRVAPSDGPLPAFASPSGKPVRVTQSGEGPLTGGFRVGFSFFDPGGPLGIECSGDGCVTGASGKSAHRPVGDGEALLEEVDSLKQDGLFLEVLAAAAAAAKRGA